MFLHSNHLLFLHLPTNRQSFFFTALPPTTLSVLVFFFCLNRGRTSTTLSRGGSGWGEDLLNKSTKTIFTKPLPHTDADLVISGASTEAFVQSAASEIKMSMDDLFGTISHPCRAVNKIYVIFSVNNCHDPRWT